MGKKSFSHRQHLLGTSQDERQAEENASQKQVDSLYYPQQGGTDIATHRMILPTTRPYLLSCDDFYWNDVQARDATSTTCLSIKEHLTKLLFNCVRTSAASLVTMFINIKTQNRWMLTQKK